MRNTPTTEEEELPEDVRGDEELVVVQVLTQLRQVVHVLQLLPKLVTERKQTGSQTKSGARAAEAPPTGPGVFSPDQRFEDVPDDPDEVCRMNDVQRLQVLLVPVTQPAEPETWSR